MPTKNTTTKSKLSLSELRLRRRRGQSVIEFAVVSMIFVSMLFISYNAVMAFAFQQYVAHAVFMAARTYQAAHGNPATQEAWALDALSNYGLKEGPVRLGPIRAEVLEVTVPPGDPDAVPSGSGKPTDSGAAVRVRFSMPLAALPLGDGDWDSVKRITLEASSFLGREPTSVECRQYFRDMLQKLALPGAPPAHLNEMQSDVTITAMSDNGC
jgi:hypothetical protein